MSSGIIERHPRLIVTMGLHGSASPWVFNVVRDLLITAHGEGQVRALYAESEHDVMAEKGDHQGYLVWKLHYGDSGFDEFVSRAAPMIIVSIRDPRDAVVSMMQRFGMSFESAAAAIARDCNRALRSIAAGHPYLRYEDGFFRNPDMIGSIAQWLGVPTDPSGFRQIFERYESEAVRRFAENIANLPPERIAGDPAGDLSDTLTLIHRHHVGDMRSGKWRDALSPDQHHILAGFAPFLQQFKYPLA